MIYYVVNIFHNGRNIFAGYLQGITLALYIGYSPNIYYIEVSCNGISILGTNVQGVFFSDIWMAF